MYGDSSSVVIGESSFKIGLYFIHYDLQTLYTSIQGRVDDLSFFEYLSQFYFLSIELHCTVSISFKILPYFVYYYYYYILVRM